MARPRRSRSLRDELAEADQLAENANETEQQEEQGVQDMASVNTNSSEFKIGDAAKDIER